MPTSSQALIMKNTDFSSLPLLLERNQLSATATVSHYGLPRFNVTESAYDYSRFAQRKLMPIRRAESVPNIRLRLDVSTLPELLQIRGIHGALSYDMTTRSFHWRLPKSTLSPFRNQSKPAVNDDEFQRFISNNSEQNLHGHILLSTVAEDGSIGKTHWSDVEDKNAIHFLRYSSPGEKQMSRRFKYQHANTPDTGRNTIQGETFVELGQIRRVSTPEDIPFLRQNLSSGNRESYGQFLPELNRREFKRVRFLSQPVSASDESRRDKGSSLTLEEGKFEPGEGYDSLPLYSEPGCSERRQIQPLDPEAKLTDIEMQIYDRLVRLGFRKPKGEIASPKISDKDTNSIKQGDQGDEASFAGQESASSETQDPNSGRVRFLNESKQLMASVGYKSETWGSTESKNIASDHNQASYEVSGQVDNQERNSADKHSSYDVKSGKKISLLEDAKLKANYRQWKKRKITSVRMRKELPPSDPWSVVISLRDNAITHERLKQRIEAATGCTVTGLRFDPLSVQAQDLDAKSQWIVRLSDKSACEELIEKGMWFGGERIHVRSFDHVMKQEYEAYKFNELLQEILRRKNESGKQGFAPRRAKQGKASPRAKTRFTQTPDTKTA
ncbi:hypothetical protein CHS0354_039287 [Potamilus streckersoni]|uniref:Uncharacterized protein n=1 Tax=Potamilus streckersoni TaxID=2493646 RepID=A0AAE0RMY8_9BIVA|nr:hypothetical protein CHS0354_039287 [Potamilus streckersoni]